MVWGMKYKSVRYRVYKGFTLSIYEIGRCNFTSNVKKVVGEVMESWNFEKSFDDALNKAINYVDDLLYKSDEPTDLIEIGF